MQHVQIRHLALAERGHVDEVEGAGVLRLPAPVAACLAVQVHLRVEPKDGMRPAPRSRGPPLAARRSRDPALDGPDPDKPKELAASVLRELKVTTTAPADPDKGPELAQWRRTKSIEITATFFISVCRSAASGRGRHDNTQ